ncbi:MAG TPA: ABC transporter permease [Rectinemataceae bacterium]|nr:ABC transporter permease [Rectinemataceae bacterium]
MDNASSAHPSDAKAPGGLRRGLVSILAGRWVIIFLVLETVYFCFRAHGFADLNSAQILLFYGTQVFLLAVGELFVVVTGGIDLSVGYVLGFASIISIKLIVWLTAAGVGPLPATLLGVAGTLLVGLVPGLINGWLVAYLNVPPFIATFSMLGVCHGVSELIINGVYAMGLPQFAANFGSGRLLYIVPGGPTSFFSRPDVERGTTMLQIGPNIVVVGIVVIAMFAFVLARSRFGRHLYAIGGNVDAATRSGVPVRRRLIEVYALSSFLASLAGIAYAFMYVSGKADAGASLLLDSIAAVMIGGASMFGGSGTVIRTMVGALIIAVLEQGLRMSGTPTFNTYIYVGAILVLAVIMERYMPQTRR